MKSLRLIPVVMLAVVGMTMTAGVANAAQAGNCTGGNIAPGVYDGLVISGICYIPAGTVEVTGNLTIKPGALLDGAALPGDPTAAPVIPGTLVVLGNVRVGTGGVLAIGCSPQGGCHGVTYDRIKGNVVANAAEAVLMQAVAIGGDVSIVGGGGGVVGGPGSFGCFNPAAPIPAPWSEDPSLSNPTTGSPQYTDIEDSTIGGSLRLSGIQTCFLASFRNQVMGNVVMSNNVTSDGDGNELGSNLIGGNLSCWSNDPAVQFGDSGAAPSMVGGWPSGQCALNVTPNNSGAPEHISVRTSTLRRFSGTHTETAQLGVLNLGTTVSNNILLVAFSNALLDGPGLSGTIDTGAVAGPGGEAAVITQLPNGSQRFEVFDTCTCSFGGKSGTVLIEAYGTTTAHGLTTGRFLIRSGGPGNGGLSTIAGFGTFSSYDQAQGVLKLTEHIGLT